MQDLLIYDIKSLHLYVCHIDFVPQTRITKAARAEEKMTHAKQLNFKTIT